MPAVLSVEEVLDIHARVCEDFADTPDPVGFGGVRDKGRLLESVVHRQHVGLGSQLKYPDPFENAATLTFGLCCGHPFNNGNKRTALVAMLAHLHKNGHAVFGINQPELYRMIKAVAMHELGVRAPRRRKKTSEYTRREVDDEVAAIASWLKRRCRKVKRGERRITYRQLRQILGNHGFILDKPKNNTIGVFRVMEKRKPLLMKKRTEYKHIHSIGYPGEGKTVAVGDVKKVRRICKLDEPSGVDSEAFYAGADVIEPFINEYRTVLTRLSKE